MLICFLFSGCWHDRKRCVATIFLLGGPTMRIISQDGMIDIPYEISAFSFWS